MQDKVQRATNALSAHSNHLCLAPGSTSCSLGWALVPALQTQSCQWVFKGLQCCSEEPLSLSVLPLTLGVQVASFPQGGLTSTVAGASRIRLSPMCLSLHWRLSGGLHTTNTRSGTGKLAFYAVFQLQSKNVHQ